jgi:heme o synthase
MKESIHFKKANATVLTEEALLRSNESPSATPSSSRLHDFLELTKPRLTSLVLATTFVGFLLASGAQIGWMLLVHTMLGTMLVAAGAAVLNQYLEREVDARMPRTVDRPLPAMRLEETEALLFGVVLSLAGLAWLLMAVNLLSSFLAGLTLISYLFIYTPLKRVTPLCTIVGAVPGAIPPMIGWAAVTNSLNPGAWILFSILFFWQMPHFYALAQMYREDYRSGGFPMLSVVDPSGIRTGVQIVSHGALLIPASLAPSLFGLTGPTYFWIAFLLGTIFLLLGIYNAWTRSLSSARLLFFGSILYLPILLVAMVMDRIR